MKNLMAIATCLLMSVTIYSQQVRVESIPRQPFLKYTSIERRDTSTFYLSETNSKTSLPLVIFIQGSGNASLFAKMNGAIFPQSGFMTFFDLSKGKYRVLVIEKPGVTFLQNEEANKKFDKNFSLESWSHLAVEAINYVLQSQRVDSGKIMIVGHSEGGLVAATVADKLSTTITHVGIMAGEGTTQLYSLYKLAEDGDYFQSDAFNKEQRVDSLMRVWKNIQHSPGSTDKKFWGFTYLRWSGFLKTSVLEKLSEYNGKIMIVQGTADKNVYPESAKVLYTSLLSKGKNVELSMIDNADHSFNIVDKKEVNGWETVVSNLINWFLK